MLNRELEAIIKAELYHSLGSDDGELSNERASALDHYHGRPYGDEMEGRSTVVSRDLSEAVDWIMPAILRVFVQSGNVVEFDPQGPEDEQLAEQESDYTNHVIMEKNDGWMVIHDSVKDALLLKNGYFKHYWDVTEKTTEEDYEGLSEDQLALLLMNIEANGHEVKIKEQDERVEYITEGLELVPILVYDVCLQITRKEGKCVVVAMPPEEVRVSKRCRGSTQDSPFTAHVTTKTRSELIEMGMSKDWVYDLPAHADDRDYEEYARNSISDEDENYDSNSFDRSMDEIDYVEAYIRVDFDGDGKAELRKVITCADRIPEGKEWNEVIDAVAITSMVPKRVPHRHIGESIDDELQDLQKIKTVLFRQLLDNVYLTNNQQLILNENAHLPDFMRSTPGGLKRIKGVGDVRASAAPLETTPILNQILPAIDYVDGVKENRTGITKTTTGLDPDILKQSTKGAYMENLSKASQKVEMIIRMLAETGIKELVKQVHAILIKHHDKPGIAKLRGHYVTVNPQEWRERDDLKVKVGLGTGSEEEKKQKLIILNQLQKELIPMGLVGPMQGYNLFNDLAKTMGYDMPEKYVMNPGSREFQMEQQKRQQQQGENPLAEAEKVKGQYEIQKQQMQLQHKAQLDQMERDHKQQMEILELRMKAMNDEANRQSHAAIEIMKAEMKALTERIKVDIGKPGIGAELNDIR